eukprot:1616850-Lingulodinium_polyedra.AAC.1
MTQGASAWHDYTRASGAAAGRRAHCCNAGRGQTSGKGRHEKNTFIRRAATRAGTVLGGSHGRRRAWI